MKSELINGAETVSMFCRLNMHVKKEIPIRSSEMGLLILLSSSKAPITPAAAADFFKVKKPMITALVSNLLRRGYIKKTPSLQDKRSYFLTPNESARQLVDDTLEEYIKTMGMLRQKIGATDYDRLIELLSKANTILLEDKDNG